MRSSRRLEREAGRNVELMWLLRGLVPGYRTIGKFRKDNRDALKAANRDFVLLARELDLLGGELVAIDGAFFHGDASKGSIVTQKRLAERLAALERDIEAYAAELEENDAEERRGAAARARRRRRWRKSSPRSRRSARRSRPIWRSLRRAVRRSCRVPTPTPGCCRRTARRWRDITCRLRWTTATS